MRQLQHRAIVARVAVRVDERIAAHVVAFAYAAHLCRPGTIPVTVPAGEPAITFLEFRADEFHADAVAPRLQVCVERGRDDDDGIALALVPLDALEGLVANDTRKHFRCVSATSTSNRINALASEPNPESDGPGPMCANQPEPIAADHRSERKRPTTSRWRRTAKRRKFVNVSAVVIVPSKSNSARFIQSAL